MIELVIEDEGWREAVPDTERLAQKCADMAIKFEPDLQGEIALLLTSDTAIEKLNASFRAQQKPTNVLSFPCDDESDFIGDIALARETCLREAMDRKISLEDHAAHLIIHGMLHLIGYDHQNDDEAEKMEAREVEILESLGVSNPYALNEDQIAEAN
ncbi:MAG: endoribonuclease YbeY [Hyphococcus sp.]|nr:MAG: endoribonuclease YbeY [Marinicaulis sp.]